MNEESVFSFYKLPVYIDCFSSVCKLIATAGSNFLDGYVKILWDREVMERKPHIYL